MSLSQRGVKKFPIDQNKILRKNNLLKLCFKPILVSCGYYTTLALSPSQPRKSGLTFCLKGPGCKIHFRELWNISNVKNSVSPVGHSV